VVGVVRGTGAPAGVSGASKHTGNSAGKGTKAVRKTPIPLRVVAASTAHLTDDCTPPFETFEDGDGDGDARTTEVAPHPPQTHPLQKGTGPEKHGLSPRTVIPVFPSRKRGKNPASATTPKSPKSPKATSARARTSSRRAAQPPSSPRVGMRTQKRRADDGEAGTDGIAKAGEAVRVRDPFTFPNSGSIDDVTPSRLRHAAVAGPGGSMVTPTQSVARGSATPTLHATPSSRHISDAKRGNQPSPTAATDSSPARPQHIAKRRRPSGVMLDASKRSGPTHRVKKHVNVERRDFEETVVTKRTIRRDGDGTIIEESEPVTEAPVKEYVDPFLWYSAPAF
jgi:hypothetical protein